MKAKTADKIKFWNMKHIKNQVTQQDELEILLYGCVGEDEFWDDITSKQFADELSQNANVSVINVRINSPGGDVFAGQAIYSMLKRHNATVNVYVDGLAASIASLIAMAGDKVIMPENSMMMIHNPWSIALGNADEMRKQADTLDKVRDSMVPVYQEKTGLDADKIISIMSDETWLSASEAVEMGFADEIENTTIAASINQDKLTINGQIIDISKFKNFKASWFAKNEDLGAFSGGTESNKSNQQTNKDVKNSNNKKKGKTIMEKLKALCDAAGLDYESLSTGGMDNDTIQNLVNSKLNIQNPAAPKSDDSETKIKAEQDRVDNILKLGTEYNAQEKAVEFVQGRKSVDEFKDELLKNQNTEGTKPIATKRTTAGIGMSEEEARSFSILNVINALADPTNKDAQKRAEKEFEFCQKAADKFGAKNKGLVIPIEALITPLMPKATAGTIDTTGGASLVPTTLLTSSFIDLLRNRCVIMQLARQLGGLAGDIDIPRQTAGASGYWLGEDLAATGSNAAFDELALKMKTVGANTYITRKMRKQSSLDMEAFVRQDLAFALALALDKAAFYGTGSDYQPKGIKLTTGINAKDFAAVNPTYAELVDMETLISADNADVESMAYVVNSNQRGAFKTTQKFPNDANTGGTIWEPGNTVNGYKTLVTNQIAAGDVFLGNFDDLILGLWGGLEIIVDPYTYSKQGGLLITAFQDVDFGVRHPESFCYGKKPAA